MLHSGDNMQRDRAAHRRRLSSSPWHEHRTSRDEREDTNHMNQHNHWHPKWHKDEYSSSWDRVKEAVRRDWQQTEHDLHMGGHELNQKASDTFKQAVGKAPVPSINQPNPPKVIGDLTGEWEHVEHPLEYGYAARQQFSDRSWDNNLESELRDEWESPGNAEAKTRRWDEVRSYVRRGYDYKA
jgi:hypothetical protein